MEGIKRINNKSYAEKSQHPRRQPNSNQDSNLSSGECCQKQVTSLLLGAKLQIQRGK